MIHCNMQEAYKFLDHETSDFQKYALVTDFCILKKGS